MNSHQIIVGIVTGVVTLAIAFIVICALAALLADPHAPADDTEEAEG
jgi:hypothetical protein